MPGPLAGVRVLDLTTVVLGPYATQLLAELGAEVIKLEPPGAGDPWRNATPVPGKITDYWWQLTSRNKRSLAIDLKHPEGLAVLNRLIASTDVFLTNFPLPVRERLKIAAADLLVHGWDLASATGQSFDPPADAVAEMEGFYRVAITPELRATGAFADAVEPPPDATSLERLVAFAGRKPA